MQETLFSAANGLAMAGWIALLAFPRQPLVNWWLCGILLPALPLTFLLGPLGLLTFLALRGNRA